MAKKVIRLTEKDLHKIIKESVRKITHSQTKQKTSRRHALREALDNEENAIWHSYGINPRLIDLLNKPSRIRIAADNGDYADGDGDVSYNYFWTSDFGVYLSDDDTPEVVLNHTTLEDEDAIDAIKTMLRTIKRGGSPENAWEDLTHMMSL